MSTGTNESIDGVFAQSNFESYQAADCQDGGHSNQTLWLSDGQAEEWCEVGWTLGYTDSRTVTHSGYTAYSAYTEPGGIAGTFVYHESDLRSYSLGSFGTEHTFQIYRTPGSEQGVALIDYQQLGTCDMSAFWLPSSMNAGLEYTDENAVNQGVSPSGLQVRPFSDYNSAAPWQTWDQVPIDSLTCAAVGPASYVAWLDYKHQFTNSSNVIGGTSC